jgi:biotin carboxyl carrier protein
MKMEFPVSAPATGKISAIFCKPGKQVGPGDPLLSIKAA